MERATGSRSASLRPFAYPNGRRGIAVFGGSVSLNPRYAVQLAPKHLTDLLEALGGDPVANVFLLHVARNTGLRRFPFNPYFLGLFDDRSQLCGVGSFGTTLLAWLPRAESIDLVAKEALRRRGQWGALLGDHRSITPLWDSLKAEVTPPDEDRLELWLAVEKNEFQPYPKTALVRPAAESDLSAALPLRYGMYEEHDERVLTPYHRRRIRKNCAEMIRENRLFVAEAEGQVVFTAAYSVSIPEATQISSVYTSPDYRNRGIASAALSELCRQAFAISDRVSLFVSEANHAAIHVYSRLGFKPVSKARSIRLNDGG